MQIKLKLKLALIVAAALLTGGCVALDDPLAVSPAAAGMTLPALSAAPAAPERRPDFRLPGQVTLCGETLDLRKRFIYERLESEFIRIVNHPAQVVLWQRRAAIFFPKIEAELKAAGLPQDLKYLAMAESDLRPWIVSPSGALGIWQFMPATARHFGLTVGREVDMRQLPEPSLKAAKAYLASLKGKFGSWALAMAAYNAGDGRISRAIASQGTNDYFLLDLPRETERYVYRIAAIKVVMENSAAYGLAGPNPGPAYGPPKFIEKWADFKEVSWPQLAAKIGCDYKQLRLLNPHLRTARLSGPTQLRVPPASEKKLAEYLLN